MLKLFSLNNLTFKLKKSIYKTSLFKKLFLKSAFGGFPFY